MTGGVQRFVKDVGFSLVSLAVSSLIHFLMRTFLGRYLGPANLGLYTMCFTVYSFGMLLSVLAMGSAMVKHAAQFEDDRPRLGLFLSGGVFALFSP